LVGIIKGLRQICKFFQFNSFHVCLNFILFSVDSIEWNEYFFFYRTASLQHHSTVTSDIYFLRIEVSATSGRTQWQFRLGWKRPEFLFISCCLELWPAEDFRQLLRPSTGYQFRIVSYAQYVEELNIGTVSPILITDHSVGPIGNLDVIWNFRCKRLALLAGIATQYDEDVLVGVTKNIYSPLQSTAQMPLLSFWISLWYPGTNLSIGGSVWILAHSWINISAQTSRFLWCQTRNNKAPRTSSDISESRLPSADEKGNTFLGSL